MQITKPLTITEQQLAQLELHSFVNIFNIAIEELELLKLDLRHPRLLPQTIQLAKTVLILVRDGRLDTDTSDAAAALHLLFRDEWIGFVDKAPDIEITPAVRETVGNLDSIFKVLGARIKEYQARLQTGNIWLPHNLEQLRQNFTAFLAAIEKNSKGRFLIKQNIAAQASADYLVNLKIESVEGETITMPPILHEVFRDLLANARKYSPPGGMITAGLADTGTEIRIVVEDTGCGIPANEIERVVEFGYRASNVRTKATRGGGYGLTKAYHVCQKLGGTFWITSVLGRGTRITILIPHPMTARTAVN